MNCIRLERKTNDQECLNQGMGLDKPGGKRRQSGDREVGTELDFPS